MFPYTIRPIQPEKDAPEIAGLVKTCFGPWLDLENVEYLKSLREEGLHAAAHPLLTKFTSFPYRLEGVVCTDADGTLLGMISTYYFHLNSRLCCLIANVCVRPSHRRKGIASRMLSEIEREQASKGIRDIFLQARLSRPETIDLYRGRGFRVTDYRETWVRPASGNTAKPVSGYRLERVPASDMEDFRRLFGGRYPATILWNLNYKESLFQPGTAAEIRNRMDSSVNRFRRLTDMSGRVTAWAAWQKLSSFADMLWMVPAEGITDQEHREALTALADAYKGRKALKIDIPAGGDGNICKDAGFSYLQTLAWMWKRLQA